MKRRECLKLAGVAFGWTAGALSQTLSATACQDFPDGPDEDYSPMPPPFPRTAPYRTITGIDGCITHVALSPDGTRAVIAVRARRGFGSELAEKYFRAYSLVDGSELFVSPEHIGVIHALAYDPSGSRIATASVKGYIAPGEKSDDTHIRTFDALTGHGLLDLVGLKGHAAGLVWAKGGPLVALDGLGHLQAWEGADGSVGLTLDGPRDRRYGRGFEPVQTAFGVSADGHRAVSLSMADPVNDCDHPERAIYLWDADHQSCRVLDAKSRALRSVAISPDGSLVIAATEFQQILGFDFVSGEKRFDFYPSRGGGPGPYYLAFRPDGERFVMGKKDGVISLYESKGKHHLIDFTRGPRAFIRAVVFLPDRLRVVSGGYKEIGSVKYPNGYIGLKYEPLWVWDAIYREKRSPDAHESFAHPGLK